MFFWLLACVALPACNREALEGMAAADASVDLASAPGDLSMSNDDLAIVPTSYPAGGDPSAIVTGDWNLDGHPDVAIAAADDAAVDVFLGDGTGALLPYRVFGVGTRPMFLATGLLDGDSVPDLVTIDAGDGTISVLLGIGDGTFRPRRVFATGTSASGLALADFNRDQRLDVAVGDMLNDAILLLPGGGDGSFGAPVSTELFSDSVAPISLSAGDLDLDGDLDLAIGYVSVATGIAMTWRGRGDGTFSLPAKGGLNYDLAPGPHIVLVADLNHDLWPDVLFTGSSLGNLVAYFGGPAGMLQFANGFDVVAPVALAVADFDGDGEPDIASANAGDQTLTILHRREESNFDIGPHIPLDAAPVGLATADLDGDGRADLVVAEHAADQVVVLLNGK